jgi:hypothetical protein
VVCAVCGWSHGPVVTGDGCTLLLLLGACCCIAAGVFEWQQVLRGVLCVGTTPGMCYVGCASVMGAVVCQGGAAPNQTCGRHIPQMVCRGVLWRQCKWSHTNPDARRSNTRRPAACALCVSQAKQAPGCCTALWQYQRSMAKAGARPDAGRAVQCMTARRSSPSGSMRVMHQLPLSLARPSAAAPAAKMLSVHAVEAGAVSQ